MITKRILGIIFIFSFLQVYATEFKANISESEVKWTAKNLTGGHNGLVNLKSGDLLLEEGIIKEAFFEIDMNTISVVDISNENMNNRLVDHLKNDDFFSVHNHPVSTLKITKSVPKEDNVFTFFGDLAIKGKSYPVEFDAEVLLKDDELKASGTIFIDRTNYDIRFRSLKFFPDIGDRLIEDEFMLDFNLVANE